MIRIQLLSGPQKGQELEYLENTDPDSVFTGLALHNLEWKTILPIDIDPELQEKWLEAEEKTREASQKASRELAEEEDLLDFLLEWTLKSSLK